MALAVDILMLSQCYANKSLFTFLIFFLHSLTTFFPSPFQLIPVNFVVCVIDQNAQNLRLNCFDNNFFHEISFICMCRRMAINKMFISVLQTIQDDRTRIVSWHSAYANIYVYTMALQLVQVFHNVQLSCAILKIAQTSLKRIYLGK